MIAPAHGHVDKPSSFEVRVLRQEGPGEPSNWERHQITYEPNLNVISVLQKIAAQATTADGKDTTPVAWDCNCLEEVCGACTMLVNGKTRQACSALVDKLLAEEPEGIELAPMSKFPVLRDLVVDRSRMFRNLERVHAWIPVDGYGDRGAGPRESQAGQEFRYRAFGMHDVWMLCRSLPSICEGRTHQANGRDRSRVRSPAKSSLRRILPRSSRDQSGDALQRAPHGSHECRRAVGSIDGPRRIAGLWQRPKLRLRLSERDSSHDLHRQGRPSNDLACLPANLRSLDDASVCGYRVGPTSPV